MEHLRRQYSLIEKFKVWFGKKTVIVLTMGKVGTLTICNSLDAIGYRHVHPHSLYWSWPGTHFIKIKLNFRQRLYYGYRTLLKRLKVAIWKHLKSNIVIVTGIRDPFSRAISAYFEQIHYAGGIPLDTDNEMVLDDFKNRLIFESTLDWLDNEIVKFTGINVYEKFNKNEGFQTYHEGKFKIFIYSLDQLDNLSEKISQFLEIPNFKVKTTNVSKDTKYRQYIRYLSENFKFTEEQFAIFKSSRYARTFFQEDEIEKLKDRWI